MLKTAIEQLFTLPPDIEFRTRPTWPAEHAIWIDVRADNWWPPNTAERIMVRDRRANEWFELDADKGFEVAPDQGASAGRLTFDVRVAWDQIETGIGDDTRPRERSYTFSVPYCIAESIQNVLTPVVDPAIDSLMASVPEISWNGLNLKTHLVCTSRTTGIAFGIVAEYLYEGELQWVQRARWLGGPKEWFRYPACWDESWTSNPRLANTVGLRMPWEAKPGETWTIRIRSDPETALRVIDADKYWQGDVTIPLTIR